jgi:hypothetical protein
MPMPDFSALADKFIEQVRSTNLATTTEVNLIYHAVDADGTSLPLWRESIFSSLTSQEIPDVVKQFVEDLHRDAVIRNIESVVRYFPSGQLRMRAYGGQIVTITDIELEIIQP